MNRYFWCEQIGISLDPVWINYYRLFSDCWGFEDKLGHMSSTRNCAGSLPENTCLAGQWPRGHTVIPARKRCSQCVVANLAFHIIGDKIVSEIIDIFSKKTLFDYWLSVTLMFWWFIGALQHSFTNIQYPQKKSRQAKKKKCLTRIILTFFLNNILPSFQKWCTQDT